ncbi:MAG: hypothetical protein JW862_18600 [Anaerolineales bacterium]|nr:hypothetical protein [Anaerolineales bacterium]
MKSRNLIYRRVWLGVVILLAMLFTSIWLWGAGGVTMAQADGGVWYVDGATGSDDPACGTMVAPCQTISYTLHTRATGSDLIRVAQGTYVENLTINFSVTLQGGYENVGWTRDIHAHETIIDGSGNGPVLGDWDERVRYPMVLTADCTFRMWYVGYDAFDVMRIGYATSQDGINWTKYAGNPVLDVGLPGEWDSLGFEAPYVIKDGPNSYKMWYSGNDGDTWRIGYATSSDGIHWAKYAGNPIIDLGVDDWNNVAVLHPSVLYEGGMYKMWLLAIGDDGSGQAPWIAYATSADGISWNWDAQNPLFGPSWEGWLWGPQVRATASGYQMWHSVWAGELATTYATATDETTWSKHGSAVLTGTASEWDEGNAANPFVIYEGGTYTMWYDNEAMMGVATSNDGITWTKSGSNPVLLPGAATQWGQPVVRFEAGSDGAVLDGFTITGGQVDREGGGITIEGAAPLIKSCLITGNTAQGPDEWGGAGVLIGSGSDATIWDSIIIDNAAKGGASAIRIGDSNLMLANSLVIQNSGRPAIHGNGATMTLVNVTLADNGPDGGIWLNDSTGIIQNSILWEPDGQDIGVDGSGSYTITYSNVEDGILPGVGNISAAPLFAGANDYRLLTGSPAIDAGSGVGAPDHDLVGTLRPLDGDGDGVAVADMGAYEFVLYRISLPLLNK